MTDNGCQTEKCSKICCCYTQNMIFKAPFFVKCLSENSTVKIYSMNETHMYFILNRRLVIWLNWGAGQSNVAILSPATGDQAAQEINTLHNINDILLIV